MYVEIVTRIIFGTGWYLGPPVQIVVLCDEQVDGFANFVELFYHFCFCPLPPQLLDLLELHPHEKLHGVCNPFSCIVCQKQSYSPSPSYS